uniref:Uncharacterized protein n=1 Tax=Cacopsylla melanoneura TaxID=428564 RepID=A0A8D8ZC57_9HEMI
MRVSLHACEIVLRVVVARTYIISVIFPHVPIPMIPIRMSTQVLRMMVPIFITMISRGSRPGTLLMPWIRTRISIYMIITISAAIVLGIWNHTGFMSMFEESYSICITLVSIKLRVVSIAIICITSIAPFY